MPNILILGGTTEASALAEALADRGATAVLSYAGRVANPRRQPLPTRVGGFGGIAGLVRYLREQAVTHLVDATHPFAATMSAHAVAAAAETGIAHIVLTRPAWAPAAGDCWRHVPDIEAAVAALAGPRRRVMLALGRMHVSAFTAQPQHHYLLRFVDAPEEAPVLPDHALVVDRGPFSVEGDVALMQDHEIELVVCKNAGGSGAEAKLIAARRLGLPVLMIDRPALPERHTVHEIGAVLDWLDHGADRGV
ncbi:cobalt-precorrin-6A reductase [Novosphingobium sp. JCM 18896]|uniref:cobalt-precorrin-6A reductase n=1 Tax=Novosphingobium sp. JCM 18896 TaxID=2989731 RepID=UPI0022216788|nr:cobalt-precorrin-6A reductase [Novosphingobium sp. JCM 18896]MCW1431230.1 cobalt-precorrin-6A reductase [Novosphingobium sp. JCM 18896]